MPNDTPVTETPPAEPVIVTIVFVGMYFSNAKPKLLQGFRTVLPNDELGELEAYDKLVKHASVGDMFEMSTRVRDGKVFGTIGKRLGRWENTTDIVKWQASDQIAKTEMHLVKQGKDDTLHAQLADFRKAYKNMSSLHRAHYIARIVQCICG